MVRRGSAIVAVGSPVRWSLATAPSGLVMLISPVVVRRRTAVMPGPRVAMTFDGTFSRLCSHAARR